ncbi:MAG: hypothetical protein AAB638_04235, partial [Patescibacteria group bacterium]
SKTRTVLAISDLNTKVLIVPSQVKRSLILNLRSKYPPNRFYIQLFSACLYLLLKSHLNKSETIIIDKEYIGKESQILECLKILSGNRKFVCEIRFSLIGKESLAHKRALASFRLPETGSQRVTAQQLTTLVDKINKNSRALGTSLTVTVKRAKRVPTT